MGVLSPGNRNEESYSGILLCKENKIQLRYGSILNTENTGDELLPM